MMWGNNILADLLMKVDNYSLFHVTISTVTASGLIAATIALLVFIVMTVSADDCSVIRSALSELC